MKTTRYSEFWAGARDSVPVIVGAIPFGILFGALAVNAGLSVAAAMGMSLLVFAGSAQFVAAGLVAQGTAVLVIVFTTFVINLRHALYSASLGPYLSDKPHRWLMPLGFFLTDETYAVVVQRYSRPEHSAYIHWYQLGSSLAMYVNWQVCTVIGIIAGTQLTHLTEWGLEFAMVATFIGIVVPMLRSVPMLLCAIVAGGLALVLRDWPHQTGLMIGSLAGIVSAVLASRTSSVNLQTAKAKGSDGGERL
ncbi:MAG: AzlC family ABC transporter permease [Granulosicoccus sp.]